MNSMKKKDAIVIDAEAWMTDLLPRLRQAFGTRLQYLGLQGSYRRGEATETSDIDVVLLLDVVALDDLDVYRAIARGMQANIGLFPNWSWCWPVNRRILYNRASVDLNGKPWNPQKAVIEWDGSKWVGDVPDGPWPPMANASTGAPNAGRIAPRWTCGNANLCPTLMFWPWACDTRNR